jgi:hypothetical protein
VYCFNTGTGKTQNTKDANTISTNSRDLIKVERYFWEGMHGYPKDVNQRTRDNLSKTLPGPFLIHDLSPGF